MSRYKGNPGRPRRFAFALTPTLPRKREREFVLMRRAEYEKLAAVEDRMWWFGGLHANILTSFVATNIAHGPVLDAGCGTGGLLRRFSATHPRRAIGLELDAEACGVARAKSGVSIVAGSVAAMPFADNSFAAIFSADVLCHAGVDERASLAEFRRCLAAGGALVLNLPAYPWLLSEHDRAVDNVRRYTARDVLGLLREAGFAVARAGYWNTFLFPLMIARRKLLSASGSDVGIGPMPLEKLFSAVMRLETLLIKAGLRLPFGGSVLAVAVKHA
jgi:SAM-dependent methyltransferase